MSSGSDHSHSGLDSQESYLLMANFFRFFSSSTALMILDTVRSKEMTSLEVAKKLGLSPLTVLAKLKTMEREGVLVSYVGSKRVVFRLADSEISQALEQILNIPKKKLGRAGGPGISTAGNNGKGHKLLLRDTRK
jgi:DNA-binding transcriptional ArsR family regulator